VHLAPSELVGAQVLQQARHGGWSTTRSFCSFRNNGSSNTRPRRLELQSRPRLSWSLTKKMRKMSSRTMWLMGLMWCLTLGYRCMLRCRSNMLYCTSSSCSTWSKRYCRCSCECTGRRLFHCTLDSCTRMSPHWQARWMP
jgi:hypothetical protein